MKSDISLWWLDIAAAAAVLAKFDDDHQLLDSGERGTFTANRLTVRIALRVALWHRFGEAVARIPFAVEKAGRPVLPYGTPVIFSVSHTQGAAVLALADAGPLGIDIEGQRPLRMSARYREAIVAGASAAGLHVPNLAGEPLSDREFLVVWTQLEAIAKARSEGIGAVLDMIKMRAAMRNNQNPMTRPTELLPPQTSLSSLDIPENFVGALVRPIQSAPPDLQMFPTSGIAVQELCAGL